MSKFFLAKNKWLAYTLTLFACITPLTSYAQLDSNGQNPGVGALIPLVKDIKNDFASLLQYIKGPGPSSTTYTGTSAAIGNTVIASGQTAKEDSNADSTSMLNTLLTQSNAAYVTAYLKFYATGLKLYDFMAPPSTTSRVPKKPTSRDLGTLNFDNFFTPMNTAMNNLGYKPPTSNSDQSSGSSQQPSGTTLTTDSQQGQAFYFVRFVTGLTDPAQLVELSKLSNAISKNPNAKNQYLNQFRAYLSILTIGLSNFQDMYNRRVIKKRTVTLPPNYRAGQRNSTRTSLNTSAASLEYAMATRRITQPTINPTTGKPGASWYESMEVASSTTLQRETLYLLAEMNYQMYQMRMQQERLLATHTADMMINLNSMVKTNLDSAISN